MAGKRKKIIVAQALFLGWRLAANFCAHGTDYWLLRAVFNGRLSHALFYGQHLDGLVGRIA